MKAFRQKNGNNDIYLDETATVVRQGIEVPVMEISMATDKNAYAYIIGDAIRTIRGELQLDTENGIPYFATVFDRSDKLSIWKHYVEKKILGFDFVTGISTFDAEVSGNGHTLKYNMIVNTIDGEVNIASVDPAGTGGEGGGGMGGLVQNGIFYLPVFLRDGIQVYRQLKEYNLNGSYTTELSEQTYIKNSEGIFVQEEV